MSTPNDVRVSASLQDKISGQLTRISDKIKVTFGDKMTRNVFAANVASKAFAKGLAVVGTALSKAGDLIGDSIQAASALTEAMTKSETVFKDHAFEMDQWAENASTAFGQSKRSALEAAGTFGNLIQAFGIGEDKAAEMSTTLVELASDLASFNNTSVEDAITALRSGLTGETEPMKRYGVALSDARMRAYLLAAGYKNLGSTLTPLQKTTAAYALILKDSALAQGDFARTAEGLANTQRTASAELEDAQAQLGESLLPLQLKATQAQISFTKFTNSGIEGWQDLIQFITDRPAWEREIIDAKRAEVAMKSAAQQSAFAIRDKLNPALDESTDSTDALAAAMERAEEAAKDAAEAFDDYTGALFDADIVTGDLAEAKKELDDLLKNGPESKAAADMEIFRGKVAEAEKAIADLERQKALLAGDESLYAWLQTQQAGFAGLTATAQAAYWAMRATALSSLTTAPVTYVEDYMDRITDLLEDGDPRASGGPVSAGKSYIVGEEGPELFVPSSSGTIIPNGGSSGGSWGGSGGGITFVYSPTFSTASPAEAQRFARAIGPELTRWARASGAAL